MSGQTTIQRSWVEAANGHADFPLQNLPLGIFSHGDDQKRAGVAIGDSILDLRALRSTGLVAGEALQAIEATQSGVLNAFFELGLVARVALREVLHSLLVEGAQHRQVVEECLVNAADCVMHLPARINDYTDFYVGIEHAKNVGKLFRPDNPLLPNYKYVPIGYHGRASTIRPSGVDVQRPNGQTLPAGESTPVLGPTARLDYELEIGVWVGKGNQLGELVSISEASDHIAGLCLLNDWSARDVQAWEYQPLGPFLSKSFITTISPWVVTMEALEPFRRPQPKRPDGDPQPLTYLLSEIDQAHGAFDIELEVLIQTERMRSEGLSPQRLTLSNTLSMYWTVAQMLTHHTVNGCQLQAGDLFGSGTLSGAEPGQYGSLLEITEGGKKPVVLSSGEERRFLEDGDEIFLRARCVRPGMVSIGFGECRGKIVKAC
ncbi:fumarylacetoacetase [Pantoea sp. Tr-811]|uniref:fumarylacetoacetase n=1 Tax=Pantoea sp. Tr-811 TaxID=2608361 RepID=UPI00142459E7|nr:fumarylacetoacetase [Pantoea sp. Tr-811]NIF30309.1 fumarylacetoacetase [Pantoea sp. Tr-811]